MFKTILNKFLAIAERLLKEAARRDTSDRFKLHILLVTGFVMLMKGFRKEARAYFNYIGLFKLPDEKVMISSEEESYYEIIEDADYAAYISSSVALILFATPGKDDELCDIGCGRGFLVRELHRAGYLRSIGIENSRWAVEHAVVSQVYLKKSADFRDGQFRVASVISVLEHSKKEDIPGFLREIGRITSDYVVCCIPLYPNNLFNFFMNGADHRIFERREWWDAEFKKIGFFAAYLPVTPTPFIIPLIYRKKKGSLANIWSVSGRNLVRMRMGLGDELCTLPVIEEVKRRLPGMTIAISEDSPHKEIFSNNPFIDEVGAPARPGDNIFEFHFQSVFDRTMVEDFSGQAGLDGMLNMVPKLYLAENERYPLKRESGLCVAMDTRANWVSRKWRHGNFEAVARALKCNYGARIVEVGRTQRGAEPESLAAADVSYVDKLSLRQTASVISQCDCFLGSDSGLSHLAAAVGKKAFTLFGPVAAEFRAHKNFTVPIFDQECYGCFSGGDNIPLYEIERRCPRGHHKCMRKITPEKVVSSMARELGLSVVVKNG